jgi:hypothetical protein
VGKVKNARQDPDLGAKRRDPGVKYEISVQGTVESVEEEEDIGFGSHLHVVVVVVVGRLRLYK